MNHYLKKFFFGTAITGSLCSFWNPPIFAMEDDVARPKLQKKYGSKSRVNKKEELLRIGQTFAGSGYKLSSLTAQDLVILAKGVQSSRPSSFPVMGRFISMPRDEGYEWDPMIVKVLEELNQKKEPSESSLLEECLQAHLSNYGAGAYVTTSKSSTPQPAEEGDALISSPGEIRTYLDYLTFLEKDKAERARLEEEERERAEEALLKQRFEEQEEKRRLAQLQLDEELAEIKRKAGIELERELSEKRAASEEEFERQATQARENLNKELKAAEEEFQREFDLKKQRTEEELAEHFAQRRAAGEEAALPSP